MDRVHIQYEFDIDRDSVPVDDTADLAHRTPNRRVTKYKVLLDSGATISVISPSLAKILSEDPNDPNPIIPGRKTLVENGSCEDIECSGDHLELKVERTAHPGHFITLRHYVSPVELSSVSLRKE